MNSVKVSGCAEIRTASIGVKVAIGTVGVLDGDFVKVGIGVFDNVSGAIMEMVLVDVGFSVPDAQPESNTVITTIK